MKAILSLFISFLFCIFLQWQTSSVKNNAKFLSPPEGLKYFLIGYNDASASMLWLRVVQNLDYCEAGKLQQSDYVPAIPQKGQTMLDAVITRKLKPSKCHKGWVYNMLNVISSIEPKFRLVYDYGANFLSIAVDDREGARLIFEKGLKLYPDDWKLNFHAAYLYLWEIQDAQRAAELMRNSVRHGAPMIIANIAAKIYDQSGHSDIAELVLREALSNDPPEHYRKILEEKLKDLKERRNSP
jgi:tetratricopeptide (TPR) repeat protein